MLVKLLMAGVAAGGREFQSTGVTIETVGLIQEADISGVKLFEVDDYGGVDDPTLGTLGIRPVGWGPDAQRCRGRREAWSTPCVERRGTWR